MIPNNTPSTNTKKNLVNGYIKKLEEEDKVIKPIKNEIETTIQELNDIRLELDVKDKETQKVLDEEKKVRRNLLGRAFSKAKREEHKETKKEIKKLSREIKILKIKEKEQKKIIDALENLYRLLEIESKSTINSENMKQELAGLINNNLKNLIDQKKDEGQRIKSYYDSITANFEKTEEEIMKTDVIIDGSRAIENQESMIIKLKQRIIEYEKINEQIKQELLKI